MAKIGQLMTLKKWIGREYCLILTGNGRPKTYRMDIFKYCMDGAAGPGQ